MIVLDLVAVGKVTGPAALVAFGNTDLRPPRVSYEAREILEEVCSFYGVEHWEMMTRSKAMPVARYRQVAMALIRRMGGCSYQEVADIFGRGHATAMWAEKKVNLLCDNSEFRGGVEEIVRRVNLRRKERI